MHSAGRTQEHKHLAYADWLRWVRPSGGYCWITWQLYLFLWGTSTMLSTTAGETRLSPAATLTLASVCRCLFSRCQPLGWDWVLIIWFALPWCLRMQNFLFFVCSITSHTFEKGQLGSSGLLSTGLLVLLAFTALSEEKLAGSPVL